MERYLLDSDGIVFDSAYIFADPQNLELGYVYLPAKKRNKGSDSLKAFLLDAIINDIRFIDEPSDNFIQRLIEMLKDPEFEESSLKKYLKEIDRANLVHIHSIRVEHDLPKNEVNTPLSWQQHEERKVNEAVKIKAMLSC